MCKGILVIYFENEQIYLGKEHNSIIDILCFSLLKKIKIIEAYDSLHKD